jgi:DmsE family decaheme c-type cytochrome
MSKLTPALGAAILVVVAAASGLRAQEEAGISCIDCHDELGASFALTPHGLASDDAPACTDCHGDGTLHMEEGDPSMINIPRGDDGMQACQSCHGKGHSALTTGVAHQRAGVTCDTCHRIHPESPAAPALLTQEVVGLCADCHPRQQRSFARPYGHSIGRAGLDCVSCHDPHGGERGLKVDRSGDPVCLTCHADLRGPYVFPHVIGVAGSCETCHQPHGSSNPNALRRSRVDQLCLECHSPLTATLGSQAVSSHDLRSPRYRNCSVCHVAVHGSNTSPSLRK